MMKIIPFARTENVFTFIDVNTGESYQVNNDHNHIEKIIAAVAENDLQTALQYYNNDYEEPVKPLPNMAHGKIIFDNGVVTYDGIEIPEKISKCIQDTYSKGIDYSGWLKLVSKLMENTSLRVREELTEFLSKGAFTVFDDGDFAAYKVIRGDYTDCHTGNFDNTPGQTLKMKRSRVDSNKHHLCSTGFHVCSKEYIKEFMRNGYRLVLVKVNPKHVVSIPTDYNMAKMRVSKYTVVKELDVNFKEHDIAPVFVKIPIRSEKGHYTGRYQYIEETPEVPPLDMSTAENMLEGIAHLNSCSYDGGNYDRDNSYDEEFYEEYSEYEDY